ncbi:interaptin [Cryptosporidium ubiquitum]|uniref:Interaptin n=1 Tax=Cryptosporidium ubiquitum TaxID=857276 RepID=A0A1J4MG95_9CRYT|nr:interaptin [Cryptosporidium ubiquitum]OII73039.1 interaptin [Cryptosporidium ubiquitum]
MQSIIKNAFDKVSVIKDVVGNSIEEAVKNNTRDASYVFNSGSSISTSIVNWAEKNHVSEKANNIKSSASMLVGDLATGLKGMTSNISIQNNFISEKSYQQDKSYQEKNEYDYFSGEFDTIDNIDKFYDDNNSFSQVINNSKSTYGETRQTEYVFTDETNNSETPPICSLNLNDNSDEVCAMLGDSNIQPDGLSFNEIINEPTQNEKILTGDVKSNIDCNLLDLDNSSSENLQDELSFSNSEKKHEKKTNSLTSQSAIPENLIEISNAKHEYNFKNDPSIYSRNISSIEPQETPQEVNSETRNYLNSESDENSNNSQLNPLTVFQKISKLEDKNNSLENELEKMKSESIELKEKVNMKTRIINSINSKLSKLEIEKKSMASYINELENSKTQYKLKIDELQNLNLNLKLNEDANKELSNTIKSLQEKIVELENALAIGEANRIESLKTYQNEISELRLKLSNLKDIEGNNYKPYITRISTLEHQLSELRRRHSNELQRFEMIIDNLKKKSAKDRSENEILENKLKEVNEVHRDMIEKYDIRISQYKYIVDHIENNKVSNENVTKKSIDANKYFKLSVCNGVNELIIGDKHVNDGKVIYNQQELPYLIPSILSNSNCASQLAIINPLQEEIKQVLHDKKLLEDEYFSVYEKNKQIKQELMEEKQRNKLLQQQLDSMFKLVNDLSVKLDESKKS